MRLTREYAFDMIELVGKAVSTGRLKEADRTWDLDEQMGLFARRWRLKLDPVEEAVKEADREYSESLFGGTPWADEGEGPLSEHPGDKYSEWGSERFEQRRAKREKDSYGDGVACRLWELQRRLRFREIGVQETLKSLQTLCSQLHSVKFISAGWASRLAQIIDAHSRG
jgi:hypothetical protein